MAELSVSRRIAAPRERVWEVVTDLDRSPEVIEAIQSIERVRGDGFDVGTRWTETRTMFGREATETMEVTSIAPGRSYVVEADGRGARYRSEFRLEPAGDDATELTMSFGAEATGLVGKVMSATIGRLFAGATRKAIQSDLDDIARAAEADAPTG